MADKQFHSKSILHKILGKIPNLTVRHYETIHSLKTQNILTQKISPYIYPIKTPPTNALKKEPFRTLLNGGGGGIRTHGTLARTTVFKTAPINRSGTPPSNCFECIIIIPIQDLLSRRFFKKF